MVGGAERADGGECGGKALVRGFPGSREAAAGGAVCAGVEGGDQRVVDGVAPIPAAAALDESGGGRALHVADGENRADAGGGRGVGHDHDHRRRDAAGVAGEHPAAAAGGGSAAVDGVIEVAAVVGPGARAADDFLVAGAVARAGCARGVFVRRGERDLSVEHERGDSAAFAGDAGGGGVERGGSGCGRRAEAGAGGDAGGASGEAASDRVARGVGVSAGDRRAVDRAAVVRELRAREPAGCERDDAGADRALRGDRDRSQPARAGGGGGGAGEGSFSGGAVARAAHAVESGVVAGERFGGESGLSGECAGGVSVDREERVAGGAVDRRPAGPHADRARQAVAGAAAGGRACDSAGCDRDGAGGCERAGA